jgi:predicted secreted protein
MTRIFRLTITFFAVVALTIAGGASVAQAAKKPTLVLSELPAQVRLIPGEVFDLALSTNRTTGYSWSTKVTGQKSAVKVSKGKYEAPVTIPELVGAPGKTTWRISAQKPGRAVIDIIATPPGGGNAEVQKLTVIVMKP